MELDGVTFVGGPVTDPALLAAVPEEYRKVLEQVNGFVAYGGGLHVRGVCDEPAWHSLAAAWTGPLAFHRLYPALHPADIPFGQDAVGDQFFLRDGQVWRLLAETGDVEAKGMSFADFLERAIADPVTTLGMHPLLQYERDSGGALAPGQLLNVYPPFCTVEAKQGVSLRAVPAHERSGWLADFAARINGWPRPEAS